MCENGGENINSLVSNGDTFDNLSFQYEPESSGEKEQKEFADVLRIDIPLHT